ncbi:MAG: triple tyrosine motif-containing protein [Chitinophagaceae bacterium]
MRKAFFVTIAIVLSITAYAQNTIGIPNIVNYQKQAYNAGSQNWNIAQGKSGIMYFANNSGLLAFDGAWWRNYSLPNKTIVRSLAIADEGRIYVGGQAEFGYFAPDQNSELTYTSLKSYLPSGENDFADIWNICLFQKHVFFRSNKKILEFEGNKINVHNGVNWGYLGLAGNELIAYESSRGLMSFRNGQWVARIKTGALPQDLQIRSVLNFGPDSLLLLSMSHGLFMLHGDTVSVFETPDIKALAANNISSASLLGPDRIAIATNLGGCFIINKAGHFIQKFSKKEGIQNNNILSLALDKDKNLWLGLDNGIDLITYSNSIKNIFPEQDDKNSGYTSIIHNNELYLGVATGVYRVPLTTNNKDLSYTNGTFEFVKNTQGQVWNLSEVNDKLLMAHNKGAFLIENNNAIPIDTKTGFWTFMPLYPVNPSPVMLAGTYNGLNFYNYSNGVITNPKINAQFESARYIVIDKNVVWVVHPYRGIYKITFDEEGKPVARFIEDKKNILSANHNHLFRVGKRIVLTSDKGIFEYDSLANDFSPSAYFGGIFGSIPVSYMKEDKQGNIWFTGDRKVAVVDRSKGQPRIVNIPELDNKIMAGGFEHINIIDSNNVFIAGEKGFFHINYAEYRKSKYPLKVLIRNVTSTTKKNGLVFGGYRDQTLLPIPEIEYRHNSLHFESSSTLYGQEQNTEYSYWLDGFDRGWSAWSKKTERDYTNLPAGSYTFKVKCRNNVDNESPIATYSFTILPPWYRTWLAYFLYTLIGFGLLYFFYKRQQQKYQRQEKIKLKEQQRKYNEEQKQLQMLHEIEISKNEKQIIQLTNEKLQAELEHKNSELATSAMNMVRKMEVFSGLKETLLHYKTNADNEKESKEFQKIIRIIDKELDHNEEWEQFAIHFDNVHTNYLKKLKELYPDLSPSELKLAAYLRLSLSTKEIAQLMNISIRGVETSRYRLRKKLGLENEINLVDFLVSVTKT